MNLHKDSEHFEEIVTSTAAHFGLTDFQVEKDYYVSLLLKELAELASIEIIFKGGTSLSKCYDIIDRFSEDIDIAINFPNNRAGNGLRRRLKYGIRGSYR